MKRNLALLALVATLFSCMKLEEEIPVPTVPEDEEEVSQILFGVYEENGGSETKSVDDIEVYEDSLFYITYEALEPIICEEPLTKVSVVTQANLTKFFLNTTKGSGESVVSTNVEFTGTAGSNYKASAGMYWPETDPYYHFYASNVEMETGSGYNLIQCSSDTDIIYAYNPSPTHKQVNSLAFNHVYGRIGNVTISAPSGFSGELTSATINASKSGTFNIKNSSWSSTAAKQDIALSGTNDVWIVPGTYNMSVTFTLSDGTTTKAGIVRSGNVNILANKVNNISVKVNDNYDYELIITPSSANVNVGESQNFVATYSTKYGGSVIDAKDVTGDASWSSSSSSVATVVSGKATGAGPGTATLTANYNSKDATATIVVADYILSYDEPVVVFSYDPSSFNAAGGTATPTVTYSQTVYYKSGSTQTITEGGTVTYQQVSAVTGFTLDSSNGTVTVAANSGTDKSYSVKASVTMNGKTGTKVATIIQTADEIISYDDPVVSFSYTPSSFDAAGGTAVPSISYSQVAHYRSGATKTITSGADITYTEIVAKAGFSLASDGKVTVGANSGSDRTYSVMATVELNGRSGYKDATISQSGDTVSSITVNSFSYPSVNAAEGSVSPTMTYTVNWVSGNTTHSGASVSYANTGSTSWFKSLNTSSGNISYKANTSANSRTSGNVTVTVSLGGKQGTKTATLYQTGDVATSVSITAFSYSNVAATAGSVTPTLTYNIYWLSGDVTHSGADVTYTNTGSTSWFTGFQISTGKVTYSANSSTSSRTSGTISVRVEVEGKSDTETATLTQAGATVDYMIEIDNVSTTAYINVGGSVTMSATMYKRVNGGSWTKTTMTDPSWSSYKPEIATVGSSTGVVTGVKAGTSYISVAAKDETGTTRSVSWTRTVVVSDVVTYSLVVTPSSKTISVGGTADLTATYYVITNGVPDAGTDVTSSATWTSGTEAVATVNKGKVTGVKKGTSNVKATYSGKEATCAVTVEDVVTYSLVVTPSSKTISVGGTADLTATYYVITNGVSDAGTDVTSSATWTSDTKTVATVSKGTITGKGIGTAVVTATYASLEDDCDVTVVAPAATITDITGATWSASETDAKTITITGTNLNYATVAVSCSSDHWTIGDITVNSTGTQATFSATPTGANTSTTSDITGKLTPKLNGTAVSGVSSTLTHQKVAETYEYFIGITISPSTLEIEEGSTGTATVSATLYRDVYSGGTYSTTETVGSLSSDKVSVSSSNTTVVTASGFTLTGKKGGSATITAQYNNTGDYTWKSGGSKATATFKVEEYEVIITK